MKVATRPALCLLLALFASEPAQAQWIDSLSVLSPRVSVPTLTPHMLDDLAVLFSQSDYRYEGALAGGILFGVPFGLLFWDLCETGSCTFKGIGAGAVYGALGALVGALIGSNIPKNGDGGPG